MYFSTYICSFLNFACVNYTIKMEKTQHIDQKKEHRTKKQLYIEMDAKKKGGVGMEKNGKSGSIERATLFRIAPVRRLINTNFKPNQFKVVVTYKNAH